MKPNRAAFRNKISYKSPATALTHSYSFALLGVRSGRGGPCLITLAALSCKNALIVEPISRTWRTSTSYSSGRNFTTMHTVQPDLPSASVHSLPPQGARV
jgi:hypothetical protein